jgi:hypothetical protein
MPLNGSSLRESLKPSFREERYQADSQRTQEHPLHRLSFIGTDQGVGCHSLILTEGLPYRLIAMLSCFMPLSAFMALPRASPEAVTIGLAKDASPSNTSA